MNELKNVSFEDRVLKLFNDYLANKITEIVQEYVTQNCERYSIAKVIFINELSENVENENKNFHRRVDVQLSETSEIIKGIKNLSTEDLEVGDYVVVFSLGITTQNAYVGLKLGGN